MTATTHRELPLDGLTLEPMAIGWQCIFLTENVTYDELPAYARAIAARLGARLDVDETVDCPDLRMRGLWLDACAYWLVFDDFPLGVTLEPRSANANREIPRLREALMPR